MTLDRAIRALLNGKAIRRESCPEVIILLGPQEQIDKNEVGHVPSVRLLNKDNESCTAWRISPEWIVATDWECGQPNRSQGNRVQWNNIVGDKGHEADPK